MSSELGNELTPRDRETLHRLFSRRGKTDVLKIIKNEYVQWHAGRQMRVETTKRGGRPRVTKQRQALLVALFWLRNYHRRNGSVSEAAAAIFDTVEIRSKHSISGPSKAYASSDSLEEHLRGGLRAQDGKAIGQWIWYLFWWRKNAVNHCWGFGGSGPPAIAVRPKNTGRLLKWIDAGMASDDFREVAAAFDDPTSSVQPRGHLEYKKTVAALVPKKPSADVFPGTPKS
jgi:hypothetical protein